MDQASETQALIPFEARAAGWLTIAFMLDVGDAGRMDEPLLDAVLVSGVLDANVNRLNRDPELQAAHARLDRAPPDELRRPVSINALASSLRLPFETVRRHVSQLVRRGLLVSTPAGVFVPMVVVVSPQFVAAAKCRYVRVVRFYEDLLAAGAVEPMPAPLPPVGRPDAPIRAVGRILSDYFFRTLDTLHQQTPDLLTGMLLLAITRAGAEHMPMPETASAMRDTWSPGGQQRPVAVAELSRRMGVPYETTRRRVGWLIEQKFCRRAGGGVLICPGYLASPSLPGVAMDNIVNIRRMYRQIAALPALADEAQARAAS